MTRVIGVDPGSSATGWAVLDSVGNRVSLAGFGVVRTGTGSRSLRLARLAERFGQVVEEWVPEEAAVETPFARVNVRSAMLLAESRGVILAVLGRTGVPVEGYSPAQVKMAMVGYGQAEKRQVVFMARRLLGLDRDPPQDAADAMAVALAHLQAVPRREALERLDRGKPSC